MARLTPGPDLVAVATPRRSVGAMREVEPARNVDPSRPLALLDAISPYCSRK
jgi:hypothetical protein